MKQGIKSNLKRIKFVNWLYTCYVTFRKLHYKRKVCKQLRLVGPEILSVVHMGCTNAKIPYCIAYGTLLGCIREHAFIKHDDDVDFWILPGFNNYKLLIETMLNLGFKFKRAFMYQSHVTEIAFIYKGVSVDFFFNFEEDNKIWTQVYSTGGVIPEDEQRIRCLSTVRTYAPKVERLKEVMFEQTLVCVPENAESVLCAHYGKLWNIPNAKWVGCAEGDWCKRKQMTQEAFVVGLRVLMKG